MGGWVGRWKDQADVAHTPDPLKRMEDDLEQDSTVEVTFECVFIVPLI